MLTQNSPQASSQRRPKLLDQARNTLRVKRSEWKWQYVIPADKLSIDSRTGIKRRHHYGADALQRALRRAARNAGITKRVTSYTLRHPFATHLLMAGQDIRTIQELLGHENFNTTMIHTHILKLNRNGVQSPADAL